MRNCQRGEYGAKLRRGAAADEKVLRTDTRLKASVQVAGNGLACFKVADRGGVAVNSQRIHFRQYIPNCLVNIIRSGNGRIAQTVIIDIFHTDNGGTGTAVFKQVPDAGAIRAQRIGFFVDHKVTSAYRYSGLLGL